jgi:hypothetical protein
MFGFDAELDDIQSGEIYHNRDAKFTTESRRGGQKNNNSQLIP